MEDPSQKIKKIKRIIELGDQYHEQNSRMISARVEETLYKLIRDSGMSVRQLLWQGIKRVNELKTDEERMNMLFNEITIIKETVSTFKGKLDHAYVTANFCKTYLEEQNRHHRK